MTATLAMIVFLFPLAWSPGPGNLFFAAVGARDGLAGSLAATTGYHLATFAVTAALGLAYLEMGAALPGAVDLLRYAGSAYVLWLAWRFLGARQSDCHETAARARFVDGLMLLVLNPKAYVIIGLLLSQFALIGTDQPEAWIIWVALVFTLNNLVAFSAWTLAGETIMRVFGERATAQRVNRVFASALALVALWLLFQ